MKFSFFLSKTCIVFLPILIDMLLFSMDKTEVPFFEFPYFPVLPCQSRHFLGTFQGGRFPTKKLLISQMNPEEGVFLKWIFLFFWGGRGRGRSVWAVSAGNSACGI